jgi:serine/threonine protein kinase
MLPAVRTTGCPSRKIWPSFAELPLVANGGLDVEAHRRKFVYNNVSEIVPALKSAGVELMNSLLTYDPSRRISAIDALNHDYFTTIPPLPQVEELMPTFPCMHATVASTAAAVEPEQRAKSQN